MGAASEAVQVVGGVEKSWEQSSWRVCTAQLSRLGIDGEAKRERVWVQKSDWQLGRNGAWIRRALLQLDGAFGCLLCLA